MGNETIRDYRYDLDIVKEIYKTYEITYRENKLIIKNRDTGEVVNDEQMKNKVLFSNAWVEANIITNNSKDTTLAFTKEAQAKYRIILNSVEKQLTEDGNIDSIQVVKDSNNDPLALAIFSNKKYIEATNKWARMALPNAFPQTKAFTTYEEEMKINSIMNSKIL